MQEEKTKLQKYFTEESLAILDKFQELRRPFDLKLICEKTGVNNRNVRAIINRERPCYDYQHKVIMAIGDIVINRLEQRSLIIEKSKTMSNGATT